MLLQAEPTTCQMTEARTRTQSPLVHARTLTHARMHKTCALVTFQVIERRLDGFTTFDRLWGEYSSGFGNPTGELFFGLEKLHKITQAIGRDYRLRVAMVETEGHESFAEYDTFAIESEDMFYSIVVGRFMKSSSAGELANVTSGMYTGKAHKNCTIQV